MERDIFNPEPYSVDQYIKHKIDDYANSFEHDCEKYSKKLCCIHKLKTIYNHPAGIIPVKGYDKAKDKLLQYIEDEISSDSQMSGWADTSFLAANYQYLAKAGEELQKAVKEKFDSL